MPARLLLGMLERMLKVQGHDLEEILAPPPDPVDELAARRAAVYALGGEIG